MQHLYDVEINDARCATCTRRLLSSSDSGVLVFNRKVPEKPRVYCDMVCYLFYVVVWIQESPNDRLRAVNATVALRKQQGASDE